MQGRKPSPTVLKLITGNPGKRALPANEPQLKAIRPKAPRHLSQSAKKQWQVVARQLADAKVLTALDTHALALYCEAYERYQQANEQIRKFGVVVKAPSGFPVQSPFLAIANKALEQMTKLMTEFGMTPSSRTRVSTAGNADEDPMEAFLRSRT